MSKSPNKNVGPIIGSFVVIIVIVTAALYVLASHINRQAQSTDEATSTTVIIHADGTTDDIQTLKNELNSALK
jgi:hypothetical protein